MPHKEEFWKLLRKYNILIISVFLSFILFFYAYKIQRPQNIQTGLAAIPGDCGGPNGTPDGFVDLFDYGNLSRSFGLTKGQPGFNALCDFYVDSHNIIDLLDYGILAQNFGRTAPSNTLSPSPTPSQTHPLIYWGAFIRGAAGNPTYPSDYGDVPWDLRTWDLFESNAGKKVSTVHFGQPWKNSSGNLMSFPTSSMNTIRGRGAIPYVGWGSWQLGQGVNQPAFKLTNIIRGDYDSYITQWARAAKNWGYPFFLRFDHEMNIGGQFSWNFKDTWIDPATGQTYKNTPDDFIRMWRHVVNIFNREGATNATWVWCPNIYFRSGSNALPFMQGYPGDSYVDWNCFDGYNKSANMTPFASIFTDSYNVMQQSVTGTDTQCSNVVGSSQCNPKTKPIMIGEWASVEAGDGGAKKAAWITDSLSNQIPINFPAIKAVVWFNWNTEPNLIIESTSTALSAYKNAIVNPIYAANTFGSLPSGTKVLPLR